MTATTEQLMALLRDAVDYIDHSPTCDVIEKWSAIPPYPVCTCGQRELMVRVEDALANHPERPESSTCLPRRAIKVVNTGKDDGDDDGN